MWLTALLMLAALDGGVPSSRVQAEARPGNAGDVTGLVVDDWSTPVAGAKVVFRGGSHHNMKTVTAETGADGRFTVSKVPRGEYGISLSVTTPGFVTLHDNLGEPKSALELKIRIGRPMKVAGTIVAPDAKGGGLRLIAAPPPGADLRKWRYNAIPQVSGVLGADGQFSLEAFEGDYELEWARPDGTLFFALVHAPSTKLSLKPSTGAIEGQVVSFNGSPIPSAEVELLSSGPSPSMAATKTDSRGRFVLQGVEDGEYSLQATNNRICRAQAVSVKGGSGTATIRFGTGGEVLGQVLDAAGRRLPGISVMSISIKSDGSRGGLCDVRAVTTDANGLFALTDLVDGEVEVTASTKPLPITVKVKPGSPPILLTVPASLGKRTVSGVVLAPDRKPIAGAMVGDGRDFTDEQGRFTLERKPENPSALGFYKRCFVRKSVPEAEASEVVMERKPCLSANVVDAAKKPVSGMHSLQVQRADGSMIAQCTTRAAEGDCTLEAELGKVVVSGTLQDGRSVSVKLELKDAEKKEVLLIPQ